jgi:hypothetical protein
MNILVKYPTRQRPELFLETLSAYIKKAADNSKIKYLISFDNDDQSMTPAFLQRAQALGDNVILKNGISKNKIDACNRDINDLNWQWDILLLVSDDMHVQVEHWDDVIRKDMQKHFPDTDGCLWYDDSDQKRVCTLSCMGKVFYDRFKYIYWHEYKSFFCDNEFTDRALDMNKMVMLNSRIIKHEHPAWKGTVKPDELYKHNDQYWNEDKTTYFRRKQSNFITL